MARRWHDTNDKLIRNQFVYDPFVSFRIWKMIAVDQVVKQRFRHKGFRDDTIDILVLGVVKGFSRL
jgi:hypothetical protein